MASEAEKSCVPPGTVTTALAGQMPTTTAPLEGVVEQLAPALEGADVINEVGVTVTSAVSVLPALSVTVRDMVATPQEGSVRLAFELVALSREIAVPPLTVLHW